MQFFSETENFEMDWETTWDRLYIDIFRPDFWHTAYAIGFFNTLETEWTINYPWEKAPLSPIFRAEHGLRRYNNIYLYLYIDIQPEKKDVLHVNYVNLLVQHMQLLLKQNQELIMLGIITFF